MYQKFLICLLLMATLAPSFGHVPNFPGENKVLENATLIQDPSKSVVLYSQLGKGNETNYYTFNVEKGERIRITLISNIPSFDDGFRPRMKLYLPHGPNESQGGTYLQPSVLNSEAVYEGFSPSSFHRISNFDLQAPKGGDLVLTVGDSPQGGAYGLIFGYVESYSIWEWIRLPFDLISIYRWEGQSYLQVFAPPLLVLILGFPLVAMKIGRWNIEAVNRSWLPAAGGLLVLGTASITIFQMLYVLYNAGPSAEMGITIFILSAQILIGLLLLRTAMSPSSQGGPPRLKLSLLALFAILSWSGFLVGPILVMVSVALSYL